MNLRNKECLVVGGGAVGRRKATALRKCGARVTIIDHAFKVAYLKGIFLLIAATNDSALNSRIAAAARRRNILVNVVDSPELCDFIMPAIAQRPPFTIAISSGGTSPTATKVARDLAAKALPDDFLAAAKHCAHIRTRLKADCHDPKARKLHFERILKPWFV